MMTEHLVQSYISRICVEHTASRHVRLMSNLTANDKSPAILATALRGKALLAPVSGRRPIQLVKRRYPCQRCGQVFLRYTELLVFRVDECNIAVSARSRRLASEEVRSDEVKSGKSGTPAAPSPKIQWQPYRTW